MEQIVTLGAVGLKFVWCTCVSLGSIIQWGSGRAVIFATYFLQRMRKTWKCELMSTHNSAENRHDHRHHFHQRGNRNRVFVTCSRSHTKRGAELLEAGLGPPCLVLQPQDDLSKWFVLGARQRTWYFAFWGMTCSDSLCRIVTSLSLLNTGEEHRCFCQMGVKACKNVHLQICNKPVASFNAKGSSSLVWQWDGFFHYSIILTL